jgi:hypothetical protein
MDTLTYGKAVTIRFETAGDLVLEARVPLGLRNLTYGIIDALARSIPKSYHDISTITISCGDTTMWDRKTFDHVEMNDFGYMSFLIEWKSFEEKMK